jgi:hypothetical protein
VDVVQRERDLRGPVQDLALREVPSGVRFPRALDVREQVTLLGVRGHDAQAIAAAEAAASVSALTVSIAFDVNVVVVVVVVIGGGQETLLVRDDVRVLNLRQKLRLRERLTACGDVVYGDALRDVMPVFLLMRHDVARAVVAVADDVAERVLLHRDSVRWRNRAYGC